MSGRKQSPSPNSSLSNLHNTCRAVTGRQSNIFMCTCGTTQRSAPTRDRLGNRGGKPPEEQLSATFPRESGLDAPLTPKLLCQPQSQVTEVPGNALVQSRDTAWSRLTTSSELRKTKALQPLPIPPLQQGHGKRLDEWNTGISLNQKFSQKFHTPNAEARTNICTGVSTNEISLKIPKGGFNTSYQTLCFTTT